MAKQRGKPFRPGDKRINRKGRPRKGESTAEILREKLDQVVKGKTRREILAESLLSKAEGGDVPAARTVLERVEGRSPFIVSPGASAETDPDKLRVIVANMRDAMPELAARLPVGPEQSDEEQAEDE